jgi:hypothetical protein
MRNRRTRDPETKYIIVNAPHTPVQLDVPADPPNYGSVVRENYTVV